MPTIQELRSRITVHTQRFIVPATAEATKCRSCGVTVYFILTANKKPMPVDCDAPDCERPSLIDGKGVSHFATCPEGRQWKKPR